MIAGLTVVCPPEIAAGFQLAGVATVAAETTAEIAPLLTDLADREASEVVAVYEPFLRELDRGLRRRLDETTTPLVIALPSGRPSDAGDDRRTRLLELLRRAVGYELTFHPEDAR
jgi:vacuolar-type H+-ATPase subunit F/Vma7